MSVIPSSNLFDEETTRTRLREAYLQLIALHRSAGRYPEAAACADLAVAQGLWTSPHQRPIELLADVPGKPVHESAAFPVCQYLESRFGAIEADVERMLAEPSFTTVEEPLVNQGWWGEAIFYENGIRYPRSATLFPAVAQVVDGLPDEVKACGVIMLSWLAPGTHIMPHCGYTNGRLRIHLGILTPADAVLRVHDQYVEWKAGRCVVFDDSFEHEVWHYGSTPRLVLLLDVPHPALGPGARPDLSTLGELRARAAQYMVERGIRSVRRTTQGIHIEPDDYQGRLLLRHLDELGADAIGMDAGGAIRVDARRIGEADDAA